MSPPARLDAFSSQAFGRPKYFFVLVLLLVAGVGLAGCGHADHVRVELQTSESVEHDPRRLIVRAQVTGPQDQLSYHWFSNDGECSPQRTEAPATSFFFGEGRTTDRVVLEVWRGSKLVVQSEINVRAIAVAPVAPIARAARPPNLQLELTDTPPYDPAGGPATRAHIGGMLTGEVDPATIVIIYARANSVWYVQPDLNGARTSLRSDHSFSTWTHTGSSYAVLVARSTFNPLVATDILPLTDPEILTHLIVEGEKK